MASSVPLAVPRVPFGRVLGAGRDPDSLCCRRSRWTRAWWLKGWVQWLRAIIEARWVGLRSSLKCHVQAEPAALEVQVTRGGRGA